MDTWILVAITFWLIVIEGKLGKILEELRRNK